MKLTATINQQTKTVIELLNNKDRRNLTGITYNNFLHFRSFVESDITDEQYHQISHKG